MTINSTAQELRIKPLNIEINDVIYGKRFILHTGGETLITQWIFVISTYLVSVSRDEV